MKLILWALLLCANAFGTNAIINCASTNINTTYSTSAPSLAIQLAPSQGHLAIINNSSVRVCANTITISTTVAPTAGNGNEHCVAPNMFAFYDGINLAKGQPLGKVNVYIRSDAATCTTGTVDIDLW